VSRQGWARLGHSQQQGPAQRLRRHSKRGEWTRVFLLPAFSRPLTIRHRHDQCPWGSVSARGGSSAVLAAYQTTADHALGHQSAQGESELGPVIGQHETHQHPSMKEACSTHYRPEIARAHRASGESRDWPGGLFPTLPRPLRRPACQVTPTETPPGRLPAGVYSPSTCPRNGRVNGLGV